MHAQHNETQEEPKDSWEVLFSQIEMSRELGRGAFGKVCEGILTTQETLVIEDKRKVKTTRMIEKKISVAVKMLRGELSRDILYRNKLLTFIMYIRWCVIT